MDTVTLGGASHEAAAPAVIVLAKSPVAGRVKTRLSPPCTPAQAAELAHAALGDTLTAALAVPDVRRVLVIEGTVGSWVPCGFEVLPQRGRGLDERITAAFEDVGFPALLVGMDTPQLHRGLLAEGLDALRRADIDAVLGPAVDGGYWSVGLRRAAPGAFTGIPMSVSHTCAAQRRRFAQLGLRVFLQHTLRDVDVMDDARRVARLVPRSRFAAAVKAMA